MLQVAIGRVEGLFKAHGEATLASILSLEDDKAKLLADYFGTLNFPALCRQLTGKFAKYAGPYQEHLANVQRLFAECVTQLDAVTTGGNLKATPLLTAEAQRNCIPFDAQFLVSLKYYLSLHPAPLARFKCLTLGKIVLAANESQYGMSALYPKLLKRKLKHIGFLYSLMQESVPYPVCKDRIKVLKCELKTWLPGASVGDKNWIEIVKEWGESGQRQAAAAGAFFRILCLSKLVHSDLPNGQRPEKLTFDRGDVTLKPEETLQHFVQRATIREVYDNIFKFPAVPANIRSQFVIGHANLCEDIEQQELMRECIGHIIKDYKVMPQDFRGLLAKGQMNLQANRQRLKAIYEGAQDSPQCCFLFSALLVTHLRTLSPLDILHAEELFEQILGMSPDYREELFRACTMQYHLTKSLLPDEGYSMLVERYCFSAQQRPFLLLRYILCKHNLSLIPDCGNQEEGLLDFVALRKFIAYMEVKCRTQLPAHWAFILLNGQFISRRFTIQIEEIWATSSLMHYHLGKPLLPQAFLSNVRQAQAGLEAEAARLKQTLELETQQQMCLDVLVEALKWMSMHPKSHELITRLLYYLPLPAGSYLVERKRAGADNGRLVEVLPGFRALWSQWQCQDGCFKLHMRFVDSKSTMGTFAFDELLQIPKDDLEGELADLMIRLSPFICNDWLGFDGKQVAPTTPYESLKHLSGCQELQTRLNDYMNRSSACRRYGLEVVRFLTELKIKVRMALYNSGMDWQSGDLNTLAARGNVQACPGALSLVSDFRHAMYKIHFKELQACLKQIKDGKEEISMMLQVPSKELRVNLRILRRDTILGEVEIHLSFHEESALAVTAKMNLKDTDEDKLRYLAWLTLMLKAKWFAKLNSKRV